MSLPSQSEMVSEPRRLSSRFKRQFRTAARACQRRKRARQRPGAAWLTGGLWRDYGASRAISVGLLGSLKIFNWWCPQG